MMKYLVCKAQVVGFLGPRVNLAPYGATNEDLGHLGVKWSGISPTIPPPNEGAKVTQTSIPYTLQLP